MKLMTFLIELQAVALIGLEIFFVYKMVAALNDSDGQALQYWIATCVTWLVANRFFEEAKRRREVTNDRPG